jgi:hypothetical protein
MISAIIEHAVRGVTPGSVRRVDGVEHPVPGRWNVATSHATIEVAAPRRFRHADRWQGRAVGVTVLVGEDPDDVQIAVNVDVRPIPVITGTPLDVAAAPNLHQWELSGRLSVNGQIVPVQATLAYRGVWRRGDRLYGWFTLYGTIDDGRRVRRRLQFSFDLLADPPASADVERSAA